MDLRQPKEILGFQFEPERNPRIIRDDAPGSDSDSSWEDFEGFTGELRQARCQKPVEEWCSCNKCKPMQFEAECKCCHELDSASSFDIIEGIV